MPSAQEVLSYIVTIDVFFIKNVVFCKARNCSDLKSVLN